MKSNLQLFRQSIKEFVPSEQIENIQQFKELVNHLCDSKLLHPREVKKLIHKFNNSNDIKFPINFQQLQQVIMTQFGDKNLMQMLENFQNLKQKLRQVKGVMNIWKDKGLTKNQKYELQSIFEKGNSKMRQFFQTLEKEKEILDHIYEQEEQMIDSLDEWIKMQKIQQPFKNYQQYQTYHLKLIQQMFNKLRVREVHFKQRINTAKIGKIQTAIGMDSRNDQAVEVTLIPKKMTEFDVLNIELLTFSAKKELMMSSHFNRFLGYNTHSDSHCFLYFSQYIEGKNLEEYLSSVKIQLQEETPLFQYWASMMFEAFYDLYLKCSYVVCLPLSLKDIQISSSGLKLIIKNIKFLDYRQTKQSQFYQAQLLQNLGALILGLLKIDPSSWGKQAKINKVQNKSIISCLLNASVGHKHYKDGRVKSYINFFNVQTHPLFESPNLMLGQLIIDNYEKILNYK